MEGKSKRKKKAADYDREGEGEVSTTPTKTTTTTSTTSSSSGVCEEGALWGWGDNSQGQLTGVFSDHIVDPRLLIRRGVSGAWCGLNYSVVNDHEALKGMGCNDAGQSCGDDARAKECACGAKHCVWVRETGEAMGSGECGCGQLGMGMRGDVTIGKTIGGSIRVAQVACGWRHSLLVTTEGQLLAMGDNAWGQLGVTSSSSSSSLTKHQQQQQHQQQHGSHCVAHPVEIVALWGHLVVQASAGEAHSACVTLTGIVLTWGKNTQGQCGRQVAHEKQKKENDQDGESTVDLSKPMPVGLAEVVTDAIQVACGQEHTLVLTRGGDVWAMGCHRVGQLGVGQSRRAKRHFVPRRIKVLQGIRIQHVACGSNFSAACTDKGAVWLWGENTRGQLGPSQPRGQPSFVPIPLNGPVCASRISCGNAHVLAIWGPSPPSNALRGARVLLSLDHLQQAQLEGRQSLSNSRQSLGGASAQQTALEGSLRLLFGSAEALQHCFGKPVQVAALEQCYQRMGTRSLQGSLRSLQQALQRAQKANLLSRSGHVFGNSWEARTTLALAAMKHPSAGLSEVQGIAELLCDDGTEESIDSCSAVVAQLNPDEIREWAQHGLQWLNDQLTEHRRATKPSRVAVRFIGLLYDNRGNVPVSRFYSEVVSRRIDVAVDYDRWGSNTEEDPVFSFCGDAPFLLNPYAKAEVLQEEARIQMDQMYADAVVREMFGRGPQSPFLDMVVRRDHIIEDSLERIAQIDERGGGGKQFRKRLKVTFEGEQGLDEGGVRKEWFLLLVRQLFRPEYALVTWDDTRTMCWFNPASLSENTNDFKLVGIVFGLAIYNSTILDVHFPPVIYSYLLNPDYEPTFDDLQAAFPSIHKGLRQLLDYEGEASIEDVFCLSFSAQTDHFGETRTHELIAGGAEIPVTRENRQEYVRLYTLFLLRDSVSEQLRAFCNGFKLIAKNDGFMQYVEPQELERIVCGYPHWNIGELQKVARYEGGYAADTEVVKMFWEVVTQMNQDQQHRLLSFATGSDRVPPGGFSTMEFVIQRAGEDSEKLPTSHTCFNVLLLPEYSTKEKLREKLLLAIQHCEGFGAI